MKRNRGFTLIELLVVIAIIAILAAILFPVFARARENARKTTCLSNLKQIGMSLLMYAQDFDEALPAAYQWQVEGQTWPLMSWRQGIHPYMKNAQAHACPSDGQTGADASGGMVSIPKVSYGANPWLMPGVRGAFDGKMVTITHPAETMMVFDAWNASTWCCDGNWTGGKCSATCFGGKPSGVRNDGVDISRHFNGFNACMADGHAEWFRGGDADWKYAQYWQKTR